MRRNQNKHTEFNEVSHKTKTTQYNAKTTLLPKKTVVQKNDNNAARLLSCDRQVTVTYAANGRGAITCPPHVVMPTTSTL